MEQIILIHGAIGAADQLLLLKEKLEEFNVQILEFDGHGKSATMDELFSLEGFKGQLAAFLEEVGSAHIFGYSMGGFVALLLAVDGNEKIKSITTLGTKMKWSPEIANQEARHLDPVTIKDKVPKFAEALEKLHGAAWMDVLNRTSAFMKELGDVNPITEESMKEIACPVQLLLGDQDQMVSEEETIQVHGWIAGSKYESLINSQHPIERVEIDLLADWIRTFIK